MNLRKLLRIRSLRYLSVTIVLLAITLGCVLASSWRSAVDVPDGVEMIYWESRSWNGSGNFRRLKLWREGRSELRTNKATVADPMSPGEAIARFNAALAAGITELETFRPDYTDGGGVIVGVQIDGIVTTKTIPMFIEGQEGSQNHRRYLAVRKIMADYEREP